MLPKTRVTAALLALGCVVSPAAYGEQSAPFALSNLIPPASDQKETLRIYLSTTGTPPPITDLENRDNWRLAIVTPDGSRLVTLDSAKWEEEPNTAMVSLIVQRANTYDVDLSRAGWRAVYLGTQLLSASVKAPSTGKLKAAKGKDDAAIYAFGSWLVGPSTKPLYVIDLKFDYGNEYKTSGWFWSTAASASTNTKAEPPVDEVNINPDSIKVLFALAKTEHVGKPWLYGLKYSFKLPQAEFTRADFVADVIGSGQLQLNLPPIKHSLAFYPQLGVELGHSVRRPTEIDKQPVDLSAWKGIARLALGGTAQWTLFKADPDEDDWYYVTVSGVYTARFLGKPEPFVQGAIVDGKRVPIVTVQKNTRHHAEAELDWNVFKYSSVSLKYRYGAEAPLFQLIDHQWTLGITVKAAKK
jgi:hypothetical protein